MKPRVFPQFTLLLVTLTPGCGESRPEQGEGGTSGGELSISLSDTLSDTQGTAGTTNPSAEGGGTLRLDVGAGTAGGPGEGGDGTAGCDKVDFLFVIDNSGSMGDEQANLIASFPKFIDTIKTTLADAQDYHLMVVDTDEWVFVGCQEFCDIGLGFCPPVPDFSCSTTPMECEDVLGAGVTWPRGFGSSDRDCNFSTGKRYMDSTEPDLTAAFECAARVGSGATSDPERPMDAMVAATAMSGAAATCNEGFLRDDAILVVTFITDEDDGQGDGSDGSVDSWHQALVEAKGGDASAVVVLGLFGDNDRPDGICSPLDGMLGSGAEPSPRLSEFVDAWDDRGFSGSVCAPSYDAFFAEAVGIIDTTCEEFIPPQG